MNNAGNDTGVHEQRPVHREKVSVDDFEHLGLDNSPTQGDVELATSSSVTSATRDVLGEINKTAENVVDEIVDELEKLPRKLMDNNMDSNLFEMGDTLLDKEADADDKMDKYLSHFTTFAPSVPSHEVSPIIENRKPQYDGINNFLDMEREKVFINEPAKLVKLSLNDPFQDNELLSNVPAAKHFEKDSLVLLDDLISDVDVAIAAPKIEPVFASAPKHHIEPPHAPKSAPPSSTTPEHGFESSFHHQDIQHLPAKPLKYDTPLESAPTDAFFKKIGLESVPREPEKIVEQHVDPVPPYKPTAPVASKHALEPFHLQDTTPVIEPARVKTSKSDIHQEPPITDAEAMFKKLGLDAWFHPERLNPRVESLIYWRDPAKSGPVFGGVLVVLLALTYLSLISVLAYLSLLALTATISFRIYKNVLQAVQKTGDGHPFKEYLDKDINLPQEKVREIVDTAIAHGNAAAVELRRLFLVDDLVDSIKFGVLLWCFTYLGAWFNGMTLVIIAWVALFTLPKVYEANKTQIDANLDLVRSKIAEITSKVKAAIPIGKKEEKKEQ